MAVLAILKINLSKNQKRRVVSYLKYDFHFENEASIISTQVQPDNDQNLSLRYESLHL